MAYLVRAPEELIHFRNELRMHPDLYAAAAVLPTFSEIVGYVAASVGLAIKGSFTDDEMRQLLATITQLLYARRGIVVVPASITPSTPTH